VKKIIIGLFFAMSIFAYDLKQLKINVDTYCFIGDTAPVNAKNGGFVSNICLLHRNNDVIAIDAGPTYKFAKELNEQSKKLFKKEITKVVLTNYHDDRIIGASFFEDKNIKVYAAVGTKEAIEQNSMRFLRIPKEIGVEEYKNSYIPTKFELIKERQALATGVEAIKLSSVSESPTDLVVYDAKTGFLFAGNIVFNERAIGYFADSDVDGWLEAIEKIKALNPKLIMGGHGKAYNVNSYQITKEYLQEMKKQITTLYDNGIGLEDIVQKCDFARFKSLLYFNELHGKNIYNYFIQLEKKQ
jgi:cyclase